MRRSLALITCAFSLAACADVDSTDASVDGVSRSADALIDSDGIRLDRPDRNLDGPDLGDLQLPGDLDRPQQNPRPSLRDRDCGDWPDSPFTSRTIEGSVTSFDRIQPWTSSISGNVVLSGDANLDSVEALRCVEHIGGTLRIEGQPGVERIVMPKLREVGALEIQSMDNLKVIRMPGLQEVGAITIADAPALDTVRLPQVASLPDGLALEGLSMESLQLVLTGLEEAGSVSLVDLPQLASFMHDPIDVYGGAVELSGLDAMAQLVGFPFEGVGDLVISDNLALQSTAGASVQDGALVEISQNPVLADLGVLAAATALGATNIAENAALENLDGFAGIKLVEGDLVIADHAALIDTTGLDALMRVQGDLRITGASALSTAELEALELSLSEVEITGALEVAGAE
jgi:hypothetical protein